MSWDALIGMKLPTDWEVKARKAEKPGDTGGCFSLSFIVEKNGQTAFMKAFDIPALLHATGGDLRRLQQELESINFESKLLNMCKGANARSVTVPIDQGQITVEGLNNGQPIQYLIFEMADQDLRRYHNYRSDVDYIANLTILRHAANGLHELHSLAIAHQDVKPSNVLLFEGSTSRIADLGRASHQHSAVWHDNLHFAGDPSYAPIEILYSQRILDWAIKRISGDLYMLGSLVLFLFTSVNMTAQIVARLRPEFYPTVWTDTYSQVLPYLRDAMRDVLNEHACFKSGTGRELASVIRELCDPDPSKRGSPRIVNLPQRYSLQRYISLFERMAAQVKIRGISR